MANKMLEMDLTPEDEKLLRESLEDWKESVYANLLEEVEVLKEKTIQELEEANQEYISEIKKEYTAKMVKALNEMREDIRSEVFTEMVTSNPELQVLEKIKALVAPTLNEEFSGNVYSEQITALVEENASLKRDMELNEGARTLAGLIKDFDRKTQNLILSVIKEGNSEEVTEQFYQIAESLELFNEEDGGGEKEDALDQKGDKEYEDFTAWKKDNPKPSKDEFDDAEGYKKAVAQWETDADKAKEKFEGDMTDGGETDDDSDDGEGKKEKYEEAYAEWVISEPSRKDFDMMEDFEYAHSLWEEDEPEEQEMDAVKDDEDPEDDQDSDDEEDDDNKGEHAKKVKKSKKDAEDDGEDDEEATEKADKALKGGKKIPTGKEVSMEDGKKATSKKVKMDDEQEGYTKKGLKESTKTKFPKSYITENTGAGRTAKPKERSRTQIEEILRFTK